VSRAAVPRVGVLTDHAPLAAIFAQGLSDADWLIGDEVIVVRRDAGAGSDRWRAAARELTALPVSVIVAGHHAATRAARNATDAIPIVAIDFERDPIVSGFVRSLAQPGGNVTGFFCDFGDGMTRLMRALRDAVPQTRQVVALTDGEATEAQTRALREAGSALRVDVDTLDVASAPAEALVDRVAAWHATLVVLGSPRLEGDATRLAKRAMRRKIASAGSFIRYAHAGGLLARGPSLPDAFRRAAATVDRLLRGARAGDIAVERPPRFELVLNAKTAAALQVPLSSRVLSSADQVVR
jgi:putative ABC transport system substrate-binding protein